MRTYDLDLFYYCEEVKEYDKVYVMGDIHGKIPLLLNSLKEEKENIAVILLGDVGANYYGGKRDTYFKEKLNNIGVQFYCLRGNHEARPVNVKGMKRIFDCYVQNFVYTEYEYPNIKYLIDGYEYFFKGLSCLALGGAYSVDKWYRLQNGWKWFADEQLSGEERQEIQEYWKNEFFNVILSHTCPYSWQPTDLFISAIDQNTVDNSMEKWLDEMASQLQWDKWLFGHFHETRNLSKNIKMLSNDILLDLEEWYE